MIIHQTQPTGTTCVQTCIAMALRIDVKEVIEKMGTRPQTQKEEIKFLVKNAVFPHLVMPFNGGTIFPFSGYYLADTPSLNNPGKIHRVLIEVTRHGKIIVYDPAKGREGAEYYGPYALEDGEMSISEVYFLDFELLVE